MSDTTQQNPAPPPTPSMFDPKLDVRLDVFEGPLDLLLYLIKKNDLDIYDIPISQITQEYLSYLDLMKDLNLEMAGEFLVMASTLMQIKAQMLLPSPDAEAEETGPDPRAELVNKLLEYQRFKDAAAILAGYNEKAKDIYYRTLPPQFEDGDYTLKATVFDLLSAFKRVLDQVPREVGQIIREEITIETRIREILDRLEEKTSLAFEELFSTSARRMDLIVTFLALLELIRMKQVVALQQETFSAIRIYRADSVPMAASEESPEVVAETETPVAPTPNSVPLTVDDATPTSTESPSEEVSS